MKTARFVNMLNFVEFYKHIKRIAVKEIQPSTYWMLGELLEVFSVSRGYLWRSTSCPLSNFRKQDISFKASEWLIS